MNTIKLMAFSGLLGIVVAPTMATTFPNPTTPFSKYGQIQNVQNYSSNPFWNPDSPYNQRMPVPVYIQGTDVSSSDCQSVVGALVASFCSSRNNCIGMDVDDARPTLTVQLASLPSHNYVTPCAGYIDTEFEKYKQQNATAAPSGKQVSFPGATTPNPTANAQDVEFQNPYDPKLPEWHGDTWMQDMLERKQELQNLQSANGANDVQLARADFPETALDLTFTQRIQNDTTGYAPYAGASAYRPLNIESDPQYENRMGAYCQHEIQKLAVLNTDLATLEKCRNANTPFNECKKQLKGTY